MKLVKFYLNDVELGGYLGYVVMVVDCFVVFYLIDWVNGGGVDNFGSGNGVYLKIYDVVGCVLNYVVVVLYCCEWWFVIVGLLCNVLFVW